MFVDFLWSHKFLFLAIVTQLLIFSPFSMTLSGGKLFVTVSLIPVFTETTINHLPTLWSSPLTRDNWRWQFHGLLPGVWLVRFGLVTPMLASDWPRTVVTRSWVWDATLVIIAIIIWGGDVGFVVIQWAYKYQQPDTPGTLALAHRYFDFSRLAWSNGVL